MGATPDRIMRMLRWANIASLLIYARPNTSDTADWLEAAARANIRGARSHTLSTEAAANAQQEARRSPATEAGSSSTTTAQPSAQSRATRPPPPPPPGRPAAPAPPPPSGQEQQNRGPDETGREGTSQDGASG